MGAVLPREPDGGIDALHALLAVVKMHEQVLVSHRRLLSLCQQMPVEPLQLLP
jgi:hypothetical protein